MTMARQLRMFTVLILSILLVACGGPRGAPVPPDRPGETCQLPGGAESDGLPKAVRYVSTAGSDTSDGSATQPWASLRHAAEAANAGTVVHVSPGIYREDGLTLNNSGTFSGHIQFISDQKWGAQIRTTSSYTVVRLNGSYLDIIGFDVAGDTRTCLGIADWGSNNRIISNNVHDIPANSKICGGDGGAGIVHGNYSASNDDTIGNVTHDIGSWPILDARVHGIYHSNTGGHIWNNLVYHCAGFGIHLNHSPSAVTVANNTVFNNRYGGIYINGGGIHGYMLITNNISVNNGGYGVTENYGSAGPGNRYLNNLAYHNRSGDIALDPIGHSSQVGTIIADPLFVQYTGEGNGDYTLQSTSPARDNGTSIGAPAYDIDGLTRVVWGIGAYQSGTARCPWPWQTRQSPIHAPSQKNNGSKKIEGE
jgi:parallel beta-helix repeat protein